MCLPAPKELQIIWLDYNSHGSWTSVGFATDLLNPDLRGWTRGSPPLDTGGRIGLESLPLSAAACDPDALVIAPRSPALFPNTLNETGAAA